jgi:hypothetical protein
MATTIKRSELNKLVEDITKKVINESKVDPYYEKIWHKLNSTQRHQILLKIYEMYHPHATSIKSGMISLDNLMSNELSTIYRILKSMKK